MEAADVVRTELSNEGLAVELLLVGAHPKLHPQIRRSGGPASLRKDVLDLLRKTEQSGLACAAEELVVLGERAVELEELEAIVRWQWPNRDERKAAYRKLLLCRIDSRQALLRGLESSSSGRCQLNELLSEAGFSCLRSDTINELVKELEARIRQRVEVTGDGTRSVLVTAPHNIYLLRDGQPPHIMEEYTTLIAQRVARQLGGVCLSWTRSEQYRSELLWLLARHQGDDTDSGALLDPQNRDPNFLCVDELVQNVWFQEMQGIGLRWNEDSLGGSRPTLHVDVHGCRDPPCSPSHMTVGLAAMRHESDAGRGSIPLRRVEAFGAALESELSSMLRGLDLRPRSALVRVLLPELASAPDGVEPFSGAWAPASRRFTQTQQAITYAKFTHSCQLEMSKALRRILSRDETAVLRLGRAINKAWVTAMGNGVATLPPLPRSPSCVAVACAELSDVGEPSIPVLTATTASRNTARSHRQACLVGGESPESREPSMAGATSNAGPRSAACSHRWSCPVRSRARACHPCVKAKA